RNLTTGEVVAWRLRGGAIVGQRSFGILPANWNIAGFGDFGGTGRQDILWRNALDGSTVAWLMNGFEFSSIWINPGPISQDWQIRGTPNVTGQGKNAILWSNVKTGEQLLWEWNGANYASPGVFARVSPDWMAQP